MNRSSDYKHNSVIGNLFKNLSTYNTKISPAKTGRLLSSFKSTNPDNCFRKFIKRINHYLNENGLKKILVMM